MTDQTPATVGHNNPPAVDPETLEKFATLANDFADAAGEFLDKKVIDNEEDAQLANDLIAGARTNFKAANEARAAAKKPHDDAGKAVQDAFKPLLDKFELTGKKVKAMLTVYLEKKEAEIAAEARRKQEEADRKAREAAEAAKAAEARNDVAGEVDAAAMAKEAEKAQKEAARAAKAKAQVASASGGTKSVGLRTVRVAKITNINVVFMHYKNRPEVRELLERLATADVRAKDVDETKIPGIEIIEGKSA